MTSSRFRLFAPFASVWLITAAAFGARVAFLWHQQRVIPHEVLAQVPFNQEAGNIALALSQGHGFSNLFRQATGPTAWLPPVYPFVLSLIFRIFGAFTFASFIAAALLNCAFSAAATPPLYDLARRVSGRGVAVASGWIWVLLPAGILMPTEWIWDTSLSVLLAVTVVWATVRHAESVQLRHWLRYGVLWALALLTNPSLGIILPFLFVWLMLRVRSHPSFSWRAPVFSLLLLVACCLPWTLRNFAQFHRVIPVRSSFAFELWMGNNDVFDPHAVGGKQRITRFEETRHYAQLGEAAYLAEKRELGTSFIRQKPALFFLLSEKRFVATWTGTEHPWHDLRETESQLARVVIVVNLALAIGTACGILLLAAKKSPFWVPLAAGPIFYPLVYYITHTSLRYRHPIDPLLVLLTILAAFAFARPNRPKTGFKSI